MCASESARRSQNVALLRVFGSDLRRTSLIPCELSASHSIETFLRAEDHRLFAINATTMVILKVEVDGSRGTVARLLQQHPTRLTSLRSILHNQTVSNSSSQCDMTRPERDNARIATRSDSTLTPTSRDDRFIADGRSRDQMRVGPSRATLFRDRVSDDRLLYSTASPPDIEPPIRPTSA